MNRWNLFLKKIYRTLEQLDCPDPFFRGHSNSNWKLLPGLARQNADAYVENRLYYRFTSLGSHLFPPNSTTWDILFLMQHYGIPTRLLDWTANFSVALYFAIKNCESEGAIWILNPYQLNLKTNNEWGLYHLNNDFPIGYHDYFIEGRSDTFGSFPASVIAIAGRSYDNRMRSQRGVFTLHRDLEKPLEKLHSKALRKIVVPQDIVNDAKKFLRLSGINEYSLFPDLDGLARYLVSEDVVKD